MTDDPNPPAAPLSGEAIQPADAGQPAPPSSEAAVESAGEATGADSAEAGKPRIKIGTQRPGVPVPRLEPRAKVAFRTQPGETSAAEGKSAQSAPAAKEEGGGAARPPIKFKSGPRKPRFDIPIQPVGKVEKPNLRAPLPEDLEIELEHALGDRSLDELIEEDTAAATTGAATGEPLETESRHKARVLRIFRDNVFVELGGRNQGVLALHSFAKEPVVGDELDVVVTKFNADDGLYEVAAIGASVDVGDWSDIAEGITVDARITGHNKGGLECEVNKIRGFIPAGQISIYRVENFEEFVGQAWPCVVVEANAERRNLVLSRRAVLEREQAEAKEKLLAELEVGQVREGIVRNIRDFGAFVDLGGIDGLVHVSQMSWDRVKHPSEVLTVGQKVKVRIQKIDPDTHKISLAYRDLFENPWTNASSKYPVTSKVTGTVSKLMDFGAFVKLEPGIEGLVHISELSFKRVHRVGDLVQEGQQVEAKVLSVDPENQRISLSMKALEARPEPKKKETEPEEEAAPEAVAEPPKKKKERKVPLQGGLGRSPLAQKFGLKW
jgi:predicted RNA-binding protein with RPS1 domain